MWRVQDFILERKLIVGLGVKENSRGNLEKFPQLPNLHKASSQAEI